MTRSAPLTLAVASAANWLARSAEDGTVPPLDQYIAIITAVWKAEKQPVAR